MKIHEVEGMTFRGSKMTLRVDGRTVEIDLTKCSPKLARASDAQRRRYVVSASGYGIHWPELDEDLSVDGLLGVYHDAPTMKLAA